MLTENQEGDAELDIEKLKVNVLSTRQCLDNGSRIKTISLLKKALNPCFPILSNRHLILIENGINFGSFDLRESKN